MQKLSVKRVPKYAAGRSESASQSARPKVTRARRPHPKKKNVARNSKPAKPWLRIPPCNKSCAPLAAKSWTSRCNNPQDLNRRGSQSFSPRPQRKSLCVPLHPLRLDLIRSFLILLPARDPQESFRRVREGGAFSIDQMHPSLQFHFPHRQAG